MRTYSQIIVLFAVLFSSALSSVHAQPAPVAAGYTALGEDLITPLSKFMNATVRKTAQDDIANGMADEVETGYSVWSVGDNSHGQLGVSLLAGPIIGGIVQLAAGGAHSLAVQSDGTVLAWGRDFEGQLGDGSPGDSNPTPTPVPGLTGVVAVAAGDRHSLALKSDGTVLAWGDDSFGQLGDGSAGGINPTPTPIPGLSGVAAVAAGYYHSFALKSDGAVLAWGRNDYGQLGRGGGNSATPTVSPGLTGVVALAPGDRHNLALKSDGTVLAWGWDIYGQLGDGSPGGIHSTPTPVPGLSGVKAVAAGGQHSLAVKSDGTVLAWGRDERGQLGDGNPGDSSATPTAVPGLTGAVAVAAGYYHSLALKSDGTVLAWGRDDSGQLGDDSPGGISATPTVIPGQSGGVVAVVAGTSHSLALKSDGTVWAWGYNLNGQLGDGSVGRISPVPTAIPGLTGVVAVAAGESHSLAVKSDGTVWAWGRDIEGQLGDGSPGDSNGTPTAIPGLTGVVAVAAGDWHSLAVKTDGTVLAWGWDDSGQLGDGSPGGINPTPTPVPGLTSVAAVAAGGEYSLALKSDGTVWAWGQDLVGQLGDGSPGGINPTPTPVPGLAGVVAVAAGDLHNLALKSDGTVLAWGYDEFGQLGDGIPGGFSATPIAIPGLTGVAAVAAGDFHSLAVKGDGAMLTWGYGIFGQLGDGSFSYSRATPDAIPGLSSVVAAAGGNNHSVAVESDGTVLAWGSDFAGQLGDGSPGGETPTPTVIPRLTRVVAVAAGFRHNLFLVDVDTAPPAVTSVWPAQSESTCAAQTVLVRFSEAVQNVSADDLVLTAGTVTGVKPVDSRTYAFAVSGLGGTVTATLDGDITDLSGNDLAEYNWSFTVGDFNVTADAGGPYSMCASAASVVAVSGAASGHSSVYWLSTGSGSFADPTALNTTYTPSASDIAAGSVQLILRAYGANPCAGRFVDSSPVTLTIGAEPAAPTNVLATPSSVCISGASVQLTATPGAGGDTVQWFTGSCGGAPVPGGASPGVSITATTTFYAATLDSSTGCIGACAQMTVELDADDVDGDGVGETCDACPGTVAGAPVDATGCPPILFGDANRDGDVDGDDYARFMACISGPEVAYATGCAPFDADGDDDVDQDDFGVFQRCYSGQNAPANPNCADQRSFP